MDKYAFYSETITEKVSRTMKGLIVAALAIALVLLTAATASAGYDYLSPVNPGSVTYTSYYPAATTCGYQMAPTYAYSVAYPAYTYPVVSPRFAAQPVVMAAPLAAAPIVGPYPTVVARPTMAVPNTLVYPAPVVIQPRFFVPGQPVRNVIRGVLPY